MIITFFYNFIISSLLYLYLQKKTRISKKYLYIDNLIVAFVSFLLIYFLLNKTIFIIIFAPILVVGLSFCLTMIRFWRTPNRRVSASENQIISPADGNVIYIKRIEKGEIPISIKESSFTELSELVKTDLLNTPCWLIGINMTPFDVHKNCSPINGQITLNKHYKGRFLSLKDPMSLSENERNTYVIKNDKIQVGVVQIASKKVRRIDSYVSEGHEVFKGQWIGMIRFGSQVDVILPIECKVNVNLKQQVYARKTIIAEL
jgi:phosphatidylserine decarboxylase